MRHFQLRPLEATSAIMMATASAFVVVELGRVSALNARKPAASESPSLTGKGRPVVSSEVAKDISLKGQGVSCASEGLVSCEVVVEYTSSSCS